MTDSVQKTRGHNEHFSAEELAQIRAGFEAGRKAEDLARDMRCSKRAINGYYAKFRKPTKIVAQRFRPQIPSRHYKSSFEL